MNEPTFNGKQRRNFFRITYLPKMSPVMVIQGRAFRIVDICEKGARISNPMGIKLPDDLFQATIRLMEGEPIQVTGRVIRVQPNQVALVLVHGIPYARIIAEQAALRRKELE